MKKLISKLLLIVMVFGILSVLAACGNGGGASSGEKLICGVTDYEPMNYKQNGNWTGFDTEFAQLVGEKLGMTVEFQEIKWENKYSELEAGTINCIWNGFTANSLESTGEKRSEFVDFSYSYMINQQCVVVTADKADSFKSIGDLNGKTVAAEKGSAGEEAAVGAVGSSGKMIDCAAQIDTFIEVKSGAVDCAVVDILLAKKMTGSGSYSDLVIAGIDMESEVYAVGFKKESSLTQKVNNAMRELYDEGKLEELAKKYGLENSLELDTETKW